MSFAEYLKMVATLLQKAEDEVRYDEYLRLLGELDKAIAETRLKVVQRKGLLGGE
jgi:hypothetical protein